MWPSLNKALSFFFFLFCKLYTVIFPKDESLRLFLDCLNRYVHLLIVSLKFFSLPSCCEISKASPCTISPHQINFSNLCNSIFNNLNSQSLVNFNLVVAYSIIRKLCCGDGQMVRREVSLGLTNKLFSYKFCSKVLAVDM